jgi:hypothetical protein
VCLECCLVGMCKYFYKCLNMNIPSQTFNFLQNGKILEEYSELDVRVSCPSI